MRTGVALLVAGLGVFAAAVPAPAHHAFAAEFDINKPVTLTGTVMKVEWTNPHAWLYLDVKEDAGTVTNWAFELGSPNGLMRAGWSRTSLKIGDVVTVEGSRAKNGSTNANARVVTLKSTGQRLFAGSAQSAAEYR